MVTIERLGMGLATLILLSSCAGSGTSGDGEQSLVSPSSSPSSSGRAIRVNAVVDGDTIETTVGTVRLIGIDTPESVHPTKSVECFGPESSAHLEDLLTGHTVELLSDPNQGDRDKYDRLLRYVFIKSTNINEEMIRDGYAREYTYKKSYKYQSDFVAAEKSAREHNRGLWKVCETKSPTPIASKSPTPTAPKTDPRFDTCAEAKSHGYGPYTTQDPEYDWYTDRDNDGIVCE